MLLFAIRVANFSKLIVDRPLVSGDCRASPWRGRFCRLLSVGSRPRQGEALRAIRGVVASLGATCN